MSFASSHRIFPAAIVGVCACLYFFTAFGSPAIESRLSSRQNQQEQSQGQPRTQQAHPDSGSRSRPTGQPYGYLSDTIEQLQKKWPKNRSVRFVFHGHSVPAGYFKTPDVRRFDSYPTLFHQKLCELFGTATIDVCVTAIGGENSEQGAHRFAEQVLSLSPDLVFIDYSLNDRRIGLDRAGVAWRSMIDQCVAADVAVVLLTPTPDSGEDILSENAPLRQHAEQVRSIGNQYQVLVVDSYAAFRQQVATGRHVNEFLSQANHPNRKGHLLVSDLLVDLFKQESD